MRNLSPSNSRLAFTLVELLVAMTVIAILVGMLMVGVMPALNRAREAAIQTEMKQLEMAIEEFKTKYGFYPPSFGGGVNVNGAIVGINNAGDLLRYVNRMSPNHAENTASGHGSESRLEHWYEEVGQYLDQESSLVFWLSGVFKNKQFPITNGWTSTSVPLAAHGFDADGDQRDILFDFKASQIYGDESDELVQIGNSPIPNALSTYIVEYKQPHGPQDGDLLYKYRDSASYDLGGSNIAYCSGPVVGTAPNAGYPFLYPKSFQLIAPGMDGKVGSGGNVFNLAVIGSDGLDNIVNFADGRVEKFINENSN